jgi:hypothetical protein
VFRNNTWIVKVPYITVMSNDFPVGMKHQLREETDVSYEVRTGIWPHQPCIHCKSCVWCVICLQVMCELEFLCTQMQVLMENFVYFWSWTWRLPCYGTGFARAMFMWLLNVLDLSVLVHFRTPPVSLKLSFHKCFTLYVAPCNVHDNYINLVTDFVSKNMHCALHPPHTHSFTN